MVTVVEIEAAGVREFRMPSTAGRDGDEAAIMKRTGRSLRRRVFTGVTARRDLAQHFQLARVEWIGPTHLGSTQQFAPLRKLKMRTVPPPKHR
jgi:hypothetical protein